jgi:hypothetical protein
LKELLLSEENLVYPNYHGGVSSIDVLELEDVHDNEYAFLKGSMEGMTVGEAFYNLNESILMVRSANNILFGDPSLKLFD